MRCPPAFVAAAVIVGVGVMAWPFTVDDAFIVARYAGHWAAGEGWAMNPGVPTDGVTGPLWALPMALAAAAGLDPIVVAKGIGLGCGALAAWLVVAREGRRSGGRLGAWVAALVLCTQGNLAVWSVAGLGAPLAAVLLTTATLAADGPRARPWLVGGAVAALAWLRPEALPAGLVAVAWAYRRDRRGGRVALALALGGLLSVVAWRVATFGSPVPLSFHAKPADLGAGLEYVLRGLAVVTAVVGLLPASIAVARRRRNRLVGLVVAVHVAAVLVAGGDWMPGFRLLVPVIPLWALLVGDGASLYWRGRPTVRGRVQMGLVVVAVAGLGLLDLVAQMPEVRASGWSRERVGRELATLLSERARVAAMVDVGFLGYSSGVEVADLGGLTDPTVARRPGGHVGKEIDPGWLAAKDPEVILLHAAAEPTVDGEGRLETLAGFPVERRVARMPWVRAHYEVARVTRYAPGYWYVVLERRGDSP